MESRKPAQPGSRPGSARLSPAQRKREVLARVAGRNITREFGARVGMAYLAYREV